MRKIHGGSPQALRESNKRLLLERLLEAPEGLTRPELARSLNLTPTAIANLVAGEGEGLAAVIEESPVREAHRGHSGPIPKVLRLQSRLGYVLGIDLGESAIQIAFTDLFGAFDSDQDPHTRPWDVKNDLHGALAYAVKKAYELANAQGIDPGQIAGIGLSIPAPVYIHSGSDPTDRRGHLRFNLGPGGSSPWSNLDPVAALTNHLAALPNGRRWSALELHIDNNANLGALAEFRLGAARGKQDIIYIEVDGDGIGAGLIFDGSPYHGAGGIAGELGHVVLEPDRPERCPYCGRPCIETIILDKLGSRSKDSFERVPLDRIVEAALRGNRNATAAIRNGAEYLGRAIAPLITLLNPERVLLGGPFPAQAYSLLIPPIQAAVARLAISPANQDYVVELGSLHEEASIKGAIWLALDRTRLEYLLDLAARPKRPLANPADAIDHEARRQPNAS
jgi:predicted NBD/HSP70 family sugar kinase